jgi:hypothetical protein
MMVGKEGPKTDKLVFKFQNRQVFLAHPLLL